MARRQSEAAKVLQYFEKTPYPVALEVFRIMKTIMWNRGISNTELREPETSPEPRKRRGPNRKPRADASDAALATPTPMVMKS